MASKLSEYLETNRCEGFRAAPHYSQVGDFVSYYHTNERCYAERVDETLTFYKSMESNEIVGVKIKGIKHIFDTAGFFKFELICPNDLRFVFFVAVMAAKDDVQKEKIKQFAKAVSVGS